MVNNVLHALARKKEMEKGKYSDGSLPCAAQKVSSTAVYVIGEDYNCVSPAKALANSLTANRPSELSF